MTSAALERLQSVLGDRYEIVREAGSGGMATVYLARDHQHSRDVAVKVFRSELSASIGPDRFLQEIRIAAGLHHPHILQLYDSGAGGGLLYFTMPFVEGESLADRLSREAELPIRDVVRILKDVADGLSYAHERGLVHRDIKPGNVLLHGRHALITDFGVAKAVDASADVTRMTSPGMTIGTPAYMAPEQIGGDGRVDHRADIYALGCVAYAMLTGKPPFGGKLLQVLGQQVSTEPVPVEHLRSAVPTDLAHVVARCLEKKPADRWQSCAEVLDVLEAVPLTPETGVSGLTGTQMGGRGRAPLWLVATAAAATLITLIVSNAGRDAPGSDPGGVPESAAVHRQLSFTGNVVEAVISPDGQFVSRTEELESGWRLVVHDMRSTAEVEIARFDDEVGMVNWSWDGNQIMVSLQTEDAGPGGLVLAYPRLGGEPRPIAGAGWGTSWTSVPGQVVMAPENWQGLLFLTPGAGPPRYVAVSEPLRFNHGIRERPGGDFFAVAMTSESYSASRLVTIRVDRDQRSGDGPGDPSATPPPEVFAQASDLVPTWAREQHTLTDEEGLAESPVWSEDGSTLYYIVARGPTQELRKIAVRQDGSAGGDPQTLLTGLEVSNYRSWRRISISDDGTRLVYAKGGEYANLWSVRFGAGPPTVRSITAGTGFNRYPKLSPDGSLVVYLGGRQGSSDLYLVPTDGGDGRRATFLGSVVGEPAWSPDGRSVVATAQRDGQARLFRVDMNASSAPSFFDNSDPSPLDPYVEWTADGRVAYIGPDQQNLHVFNPETGEDRSVLPPDSAVTGALWDQRPHPSKPLVAAYWLRFNWPDRGLYVVSLDDGAFRRLAAGNIYPAGWSPDGDWVYAFDDDNDRLVRVSLEAPSLEALVALPGSADYGQHTVDGSVVVVSIPGVRADAWSIESFDPGNR